MRSNVKNLALASASAVAAMSAARAVPTSIERKDGDPATLSLELKKGFEDFNKAFDDYKKKNDTRLADLEKKGSADVVTKEELEKLDKALDEIKSGMNAELAKLKRPRLAGEEKMTDAQIEYSKGFENFFRTGEGDRQGDPVGHKKLRELEQKALSSESGPDGGFTVRPQMETAIDEVLKQVSPIRDLASVVQIGTGTYQKLSNQHGTASGWVGEHESRPQTLAATLAELSYTVGEIYAMPAATQTLLDDSFVNIDEWLAGEVSLEFAYQEGAAFVGGNGVKKPQGFLAYTTVGNASYAWGKIGYIASGANGDYDGTIKGDCLVDLYHALKSPYRANAKFTMNNSTLAKTRKLKDGQGNYLVNTSLTLAAQNGGAIESIMGKPVIEVPDMPDPANNSLSVAFGDFKRGYLIVDRVGIRTLRDPYSAKPYVLFYTTKRVGGGVQNYEAIKLLKFATS